jgi:hypothetical protein
MFRKRLNVSAHGQTVEGPTAEHHPQATSAWVTEKLAVT